MTDWELAIINSPAQTMDPSNGKELYPTFNKNYIPPRTSFIFQQPHFTKAKN